MEKDKIDEKSISWQVKTSDGEYINFSADSQSFEDGVLLFLKDGVVVAGFKSFMYFKKQSI